jgi:hypothetical protein
MNNHENLVKMKGKELIWKMLRKIDNKKVMPENPLQQWKPFK